MRVDANRLATVFIVTVTIATLTLVGVYGACKLAVGDLNAESAIVRGEVPVPSRSAVGQVLSALFTGDLSPTDQASLEARALELDHRADRLLEMTAVVALAGMLAAFVTGPPAAECAQARAETIPLTNTTSNGTV